MPWNELATLTKTQADADGALGVSERTYAAAYALRATNCGILYPIPSGADYLTFRFRGKTNGGNHTIDVWMGRMATIDGVKNADLYRVATLDVEIGTQVAVGSPTNFTLLADEITVTNATTQSPVANAAAYQSANDSEFMAQLVIPPAGNDLLVFHGHTAFAADIKVDWSIFS
jgi:hypothetical protein